MKNILFGAIFVSLISAAGWADDFDSARLNNWHHWRGPEMTGVAPLGDPPVEWSEDKNIKWKVDLPGGGSGTPIIWDDQVFVLMAIKTDKTIELPPQPQASGRRRGPHNIERPSNYFQFVFMSLDRATGKVLWEKVVREEVPHEGHHPTHGFASGSATTDGRYLYGSFGSRGVYCLDLKGNVIWERDLGDMRMRLNFGEAETPVLYGDSLISNWDQEGQSFIEVMDSKTGKTKWRVDRQEDSAWATPIVVEHKGRTQVITNATRRTRSYDLETGELIWERGGQTFNAIPSPVIFGDTVICMSGFRGKALYAISLDSKGDLTEGDEYLWHHDRGTPYVPSPILYGDRLFFTDTNSPILTVLNARTGELFIDKERVPGLKSLYASPVGAAGRIYFTSREGSTTVIKNALKLEVLATNKLDDDIDASPAIVGKEIFLRGWEHLYCIAEL